MRAGNNIVNDETNFAKRVIIELSTSSQIVVVLIVAYPTKTRYYRADYSILETKIPVSAWGQVYTIVLGKNMVFC
jgi:hypothetical protein